jgi:hypothetical protein
MPEDQWPEFTARAIACYQAASPALARMLRDDIAASSGAALPSALARNSRRPNSRRRLI